MTTAYSAKVVTDEDLIRAIHAGNPQAFDTLVRRHYKNIVHWLIPRLNGDRCSAEDVAQVAFSKAWEHIERFDFKCSFKTWIYHIARNLAITHFYGRTRQEKGFARYERHLNCNPRVNEIDLDADLQYHPLRALLLSAISKLTPREKALLQLLLEDVSLKDISDRWGENPKHVNVWHYRAIQKLKKDPGLIAYKRGNPEDFRSLFSSG